MQELGLDLLILCLEPILLALGLWLWLEGHWPWYWAFAPAAGYALFLGGIVALAFWLLIITDDR